MAAHSSYLFQEEPSNSPDDLSVFYEKHLSLQCFWKQQPPQQHISHFLRRSNKISLLYPFTNNFLPLCSKAKKNRNANPSSLLGTPFIGGPLRKWWGICEVFIRILPSFISSLFTYFVVLLCYLPISLCYFPLRGQDVLNLCLWHCAGHHTGN